MRTSVVSCFFVATAGCSGGEPAAGGAADGGTAAASYTVTFGPVQVAANTERTQCIVVRLGNPVALHIGRIHDLLGTSSHHMIVYKVNDTIEQPTPFDCRPFTDTLDPAKGNPLIISQKKDDSLELPQGVAFTLDPNQMVRLEMHYINASAAPVTLKSTSTLVPLPDGDFQEASFLFIGDPEISIAPQSSATLGPVFFRVPGAYSNSNFFAITGHEHQWGKNVRVWTATTASDPGKAIYDVPGWTWSEPKTVTFDSPFHVPSGGGFRFQCDWFNASSNTVAFGESANNEMCFFWAYYYPSQGAKVCFHIGTRDECCPGTSGLCAAISGAASNSLRDASSE